MEYGPIFKKYMNLCGKTQFSNNRLSNITKDELIVVAHNLYQKFPSELSDYWTKDDNELIQIIYNTLKNIDLR